MENWGQNSWGKNLPENTHTHTHTHKHTHTHTHHRYMYCRENPNTKCISITASLVLIIGHAITKAQNHLEKLQLKCDASAFSVSCWCYYQSPATPHATYIWLWQKCMKVRLSATVLTRNITLVNSGRNIPSHFHTFHTWISHYISQFVERTIFWIRGCIPNILFMLVVLLK
jgi:hypothetical protein